MYPNVPHRKFQLIFKAMAGLKKRNNTWFASYYVNGKRIIKTTQIEVSPSTILPGKTKAKMEAELKLNAQIIANELEKAAKGEKANTEIVHAVAGSSKAKALLKGKAHMQGVDDFLKDWMKSRTEKGAVDRDGKAVRQFLCYLDDRKTLPLDAVTPHHAEEFMAKELERVSSGTVKRYLESLTCAFNSAVSKRIITINPFKGVIPSKSSRNDRQERDAFSVEEVQKMISDFPNEWPDMIQVCLYTGGQRLGDIAKLKWEQIDLEGGRISMTSEKTKRRMNKPVIEQLKEILQRRHEKKINDYVFPLSAMRHSQAGNSSKLSWDFTELLRKHGLIVRHDQKAQGNRRTLAEKSFHSLRATAVTMLRSMGVSPDMARYIVGHDSEDIERGYYRPQEEAVAESIAQLGQAISPQSPSKPA